MVHEPDACTAVTSASIDGAAQQVFRARHDNVSALQGTIRHKGRSLDPEKSMVATVLILMGTQPIASGSVAGNDWLLPAPSAGV